MATTRRGVLAFNIVGDALRDAIDPDYREVAPEVYAEVRENP